MATLVDHPGEPDFLRRLVLDNPWWDGITDDKVHHLSPRAFFKRFWTAVEKNDGSKAVILTGPRGVGKTVMLRQAISQLLDGDTPRRHVCYVSLEHPLFMELDLVRLPKMLRATRGISADHPLWLFIDEVSYQRDWESSLSRLLTVDPMLRVVAVSALAPTAAAKSHLTTLFLPPFSFAEYLEQRGINPRDVLPAAPNASRYTADIPDGLTELNHLFEDYIYEGGFHDRDGEAGAIHRSLHSDLPGLHGISSPSDLHRLFVLLAYNTGSEFSIETLARELDIAKNTLRRYLDYLESAWLVRRLERVDQDARLFQRAVAFKVHLIHPGLRSGLTGGRAEDSATMTRLVETAIQTQFLASNAGMESLFYARWGHYEVPFVFLDRRNGTPLFAYHCLWRDEGIRKPREVRALVNFKTAHALPLGAFVLTKAQWHGGKLGGEAMRFEPASVLALRIGLEFSQL
ncbi:ATP-binding protein [Thalassospira sp.]|uniref:ATP-binding protein n=1 Tax=Thalassospira sp. TaxID=1912094 RepID=UPI002732559F|nr:AAA family ATPase [Thalassospira sp.]MDP2698964.1 AAA family ATPase [Thalassospira sp.]